MNRSLLWIEPSALQSKLTQAGFPSSARSSRQTSAMQPASLPPANGSTQQHPGNVTRSLSYSNSQLPATPTAASSEEAALLSFPASFATLTQQDKLIQFVAWLADKTNADTVFLADQDGLPIASHRASEEDVALPIFIQQHVTNSYKWLSNSEQPLDLALESMVLRIDHMFYLGLLWAKGLQQTVALGVLFPYHPERSTMDAIRTALYAVLREPGSEE
jgi:hypothetical protein